MELVITPVGEIRCLYTESLDLKSLGHITIRRGSHVESDSGGEWSADLSPVGGPHLGPFPRQSNALRAEVAWPRDHWLVPLTVSELALSQQCFCLRRDSIG